MNLSLSCGKIELEVGQMSRGKSITIVEGIPGKAFLEGTIATLDNLGVVINADTPEILIGSIIRLRYRADDGLIVERSARVTSSRYGLHCLSFNL